MKNILLAIFLIYILLSVFSCTNKQSQQTLSKDKITSEDTIVCVKQRVDTTISINEDLSLSNPESQGMTLDELRDKYVFSEDIKERPFRTVEQMPQYPGGEAEMRAFILKNIKFPDIAEESGLQGRIVVRFVVDKTGNIRDAKVLRGMHPEYDSAFLNVINTMPRWIPGKQNGKEVDVYYTLPISPHFR